MKDAFRRGSAVAGIVGALAGSTNGAVLHSTAPELTKQYGKYARHVRLPETGRAIGRELDRATRDKAARERGNALMTKKNMKKLK
ncbi:hypothetical protein [Microbacterium sp. NPDC056569]|uniref:hypothetical protein n=1 Tax=Microbacterium sp. NPDC056569 TaxID=3345867 RepID=UPI0036724321